MTGSKTSRAKHPYTQKKNGAILFFGSERLGYARNPRSLMEGYIALQQFRPLLLGKHVLVRTDNTAAVSYINRLGGIRSHRMSQLARHLLLWSPTQFKSLRAVHIPGKLNRAADAFSRQLSFSFPREGLIWCNPSGVTAAADAICPRSLWNCFSVTTFLPLKELRQFSTAWAHSSVRRAVILTESNSTPRKEILCTGESLLFSQLTRSPNWLKCRSTKSLGSPNCSLDWARISQSSR